MSLKTYLPKCGNSSTFQKVQCKIQGSECPENTKEKIKLIITEQERDGSWKLQEFLQANLQIRFK
jgi:hypothetical protein